MSARRYRDYSFLRFLRWFKGKFCFVIDSIDSLHRAFYQKRASRKVIRSNPECCLHVMCVKRDDYILPTINCVNSFWQFHPEYRVKIWCDNIRKESLENLRFKFHRKDRVEFCEIELESHWQENKLKIICEELSPKHIFSDADMFWNGRIDVSETPLFFLREFNFDSFSTTKRLASLLELDVERDWFMLNVSVVNLGSLSNNLEFRKRALQLCRFILDINLDEVLGERDLLQMKRTSEQLALSIAVQEVSDFHYLKESDSVMDGGIAESYYLGATKGF
jgi:hypothetical protein